MTMISKDIFLRLMDTCDVKTLKELSTRYGYKENWATTTRKREGIPFDVCAKVAQEKGVSMDYLLFGSEEEATETYDGYEEINHGINKLKQAITDGVYRAEKFEILTINGEWRISTITDFIIKEITDVFTDKVNKDNRMFKELMEKLKEE